MDTLFRCTGTFHYSFVCWDFLIFKYHFFIKKKTNQTIYVFCFVSANLIIIITHWQSYWTLINYFCLINHLNRVEYFLWSDSELNLNTSLSLAPHLRFHLHLLHLVDSVFLQVEPCLSEPRCWRTSKHWSENREWVTTPLWLSRTKVQRGNKKHNQKHNKTTEDIKREHIFGCKVHGCDKTTCFLLFFLQVTVFLGSRWLSRQLSLSLRYSNCTFNITWIV